MLKLLGTGGYTTFLKGTGEFWVMYLRWGFEMRLRRAVIHTKISYQFIYQWTHPRETSDILQVLIDDSIHDP